MINLLLSKFFSMRLEKFLNSSPSLQVDKGWVAVVDVAHYWAYRRKPEYSWDNFFYESANYPVEEEAALRTVKVLLKAADYYPCHPLKHLTSNSRYSLFLGHYYKQLNIIKRA